MEKLGTGEKVAVGVVILIFAFIIFQTAIYLNLFGLGLGGAGARAILPPEPGGNLLLEENVSLSASSHNTDEQRIEAVIDNNPDTFWHIDLAEAGRPAEITVDFGEGNQQIVRRVAALPRSDLPRQFLRQARLYAGNDGKSWEPVAELILRIPPTVAEWWSWEFDNDRAYRYYRLRVLQGHEDGSRYNFYSLAGLQFR